MTATTFTTDLHLLCYTALVSLLMWIPYILCAIKQFGLMRMVGYPACDYAELPQWAQRLHHAHRNMGENLAAFAIFVIVAHITGTANEMTELGARMFFYSRLLQIAGHTAGIPFARTITFAVGWAGNLLILLQIIGY